MFLGYTFVHVLLFALQCSPIQLGVIIFGTTLNVSSIHKQIQMLTRGTNVSNEINVRIDFMDKFVCNCRGFSMMKERHVNDSVTFIITPKPLRFLTNLLKNLRLKRTEIFSLSSYSFIGIGNYYNQQLLKILSSLLNMGTSWVTFVTNEELYFCLRLSEILTSKSVKMQCSNWKNRSSTSVDDFMIDVFRKKTLQIMLISQSTVSINTWLQGAIRNGLTSSLYSWIVVTNSCFISPPQQLMNLSVICSINNETTEIEIAAYIYSKIQEKDLNTSTKGYSISDTHKIGYYSLGKCSGNYTVFRSRIWSEKEWSYIQNSSCNNMVEKMELLTCISLEDPFIFNVTKSIYNTSEALGYIIRLLKYLESRLPIAFKMYNHSKYLSCILDMENKKASLSIGRDLSIEYNITNFLRSETLYWEPIRIFVHKPENDSKLWNIFRPLHYEVWILCIISCFISAFTGVLLSKYSPLSAWNLGLEISICDEISFVENLWAYIGASLMQGQDFYPYSISSRVVLAIWWIFVVFMSNVYSADLTSFLTLSNSMKRFSSLDELLTSNQYMVYAVRDSRIHNIMKVSNESRFQTMAKKVILVESMDLCIGKVLNSSIAACIGDASPLIRTATRNCSSTYMIDEYFYFQPISFLMPLNAIIKTILNKEIQMMMEIGYLDKWEIEHWYTADAYDQPCNQDFSSSILGLADIEGAFILTAILFALGLVILIMEFFMQYFIRRKSTVNCATISTVSRAK